MLRYWVWLSNALGPGGKGLLTLLGNYQDVKEIYENRIDAVKLLNFKSAGQKRFLEATIERSNEILSDTAFLGGEVITFDSEFYPMLLREIPDPPPVLYCMGDKSLLTANLPVAMVGSRKLSEYGHRMTMKFSSELAQYGATIITGINVGGDELAHKGAYSSGGKTIAVLPEGLDFKPRVAIKNLYKGTILKHGLAVTEVPAGTPYRKDAYNIRNRLISGMAHCLVVPQAGQSGGVMLTVTSALEQGRDVFCPPANLDDNFSAGTNKLLEDGALYASSGKQILSHYSFNPVILHKTPEVAQVATPVAEFKKDYSHCESAREAVQMCLFGNSMTIDEISEATGFNIVEITAEISILEMEGLVDVGKGKICKLIN